MRDRIRSRLTFANVISVIAVFIAIGGTSIAAVKLNRNQVKSKHIGPDAVQGVDANESSFGKVPSAGSADNATNATNATNALHANDADSLGGIGALEYQLGNGEDDGVAGFVDDGQAGGIATFAGAVLVRCDATPTVDYNDFAGEGVVTDVWIAGNHEELADGGSAAEQPLPGTTQGSVIVHIWGGGDQVTSVTASAKWNPGDTDCTVAFNAQNNFNAAAQASAERLGTQSRGERKGGGSRLRPVP